MFAGIINDAKSAVSSVILKYVARASVAVPFVVAGGFALAAGTVMLVERYGHVFAYLSMAGGLAAVGLVAALAVRVKEHAEEKADVKAEAVDTSQAAKEVAKEAPLALLGGLLTLPGGLGMVLKVAKVLGNNYALVLLLVAVGTLLWPTEERKAGEPPTSNLEPTAPIPPENVVAFAHRTDVRTGSRAWPVIAIGLGVALVAASVFVVDPMETKRAIMAQLGW